MPHDHLRHLLSVTSGTREVDLRWSDGTVSRFHHRWLRDNSPQARHPETQHRVEESSAIPRDLAPLSVAIDATGHLAISWPDGHESCFDPTWLAAHDYSRGARWQRREPVLWDGTFAPSVARLSYGALGSDPTARVEWLRSFRDHGLVVLTDIPHREGIVAEIGEDLGRVRTTSWGRVFDVKSIAKANSVAYTSLPLVLHTDEGYRDPVPTVQLQHFLISESGGGDATLVDGFKVAADLRDHDPAAFELLARTPVHFHFRDTDIVLEATRTIVELGPEGEVRAVRYSNHSAQPFLVDADRMDAFYDAYTTLGAMREDPRYRIQVPMDAGEMYMVDNRRVMHGRTGFTSGGSRHLQSCYIEADELFGRLAVLEVRLESAVRS